MFRKTLGLIVVAFLLAGTLLLIGCDDDDDPTGPTTPANLLLEFDFENFARGQQVGSHT